MWNCYCMYVLIVCIAKPRAAASLFLSFLWLYLALVSYARKQKRSQSALIMPKAYTIHIYIGTQNLVGIYFIVNSHRMETYRLNVAIQFSTISFSATLSPWPYNLKAVIDRKNPTIMKKLAYKFWTLKFQGIKFYV